ncbi:MAG: hypothetical protein R3F20_13705 [Planctomycetota bacterium]
MKILHTPLERLLALVVAAFLAVGANAQDEHWSRQFKKPASTTKMGPGTGMSDGNTKPRVRRVKWHDGRLWMSGAWESGVSAAEPGKSRRNEYWHLWTYSPTAGYEPVCWFHTTDGGAGPDGQIFDFEWLPDGRLVVAGSFTRLDNPGGTRFHRVNALAIYDPNEPTADKWKPLGNFQYNGTVSAGGSIEAIAYDPNGNDLYIGGTFEGIRGVHSPKIHRYDFDTGSFEPVAPGVWGQKALVHRIKIDASTKPSKVYVGGKFHYTAGDGQNPAVSTATSRYSTGFAMYRPGEGWTTFPLAQSKEDESVLQRAADFMHFDSVNVLDFLVDGDEIWIVGAFSEGKDGKEPLRGIARWDADAQVWRDPTGKGGVGREIWSIAKADNGKIYCSGAFGGMSKPGTNFDGFKNGEAASMATVYDPATKTWSSLGTGLASLSFPECRMAVNGNDVYFVGDFHYFGAANDKKADCESWLIARWNEDVDFTVNPAEVAAEPVPSPRAPIETTPLATGNEHWSRAFPAPGRRKRPDQPAHDATTGMDIGTGTPDIRGLVAHEGRFYFVGSWAAVPNQRWFVWSRDDESGWTPLAWEDRGKKTGPTSTPEGAKIRDGRLWVFGSLVDYQGVAIYDIAAKTWSKLEGTFAGKTVIGNAVTQGGGPINDIAWDDKTGDLYLIGSSGLEHAGAPYPKDVGPVIRIDKDGVYHPMGKGLYPEDPNKPRLVFSTILLDTTQDPTDIYIGGTFNYYGGTPTSKERMAFNVAKWDHAKGDWGPLGGGAPPAAIDAKNYPQGYPGLPARPFDTFSGFLRSDFPWVRSLVMDKEGNLFAAGCIAVVDDRLPVAERKESFGLARYDKASDTWQPFSVLGGTSRDILEMTWLDEARTRLLLSGAFEYDNAWRPLNGVAILDVTTGEISPLGGGLMREGRDQVVAPMVHHTIVDGVYYFAGLFDHAGINANSRLEAPVSASCFAAWNPDANLDPNANLVVTPVDPIVGGPRIAQHKVTVRATAGEGETLTWYERASNGQYNKKGQGPEYNASVRAKSGDGDQFVYVAVTRADGVEGGKVPVRIPVR